MNFLQNERFWMAVRQALLAIVDAIERELNMKVTTAEIRKEYSSKL